MFRVILFLYFLQISNVVKEILENQHILITTFLMMIGEVVETWPLGDDTCLSIHFSASLDLKYENDSGYGQ